MTEAMDIWHDDEGVWRKIDHQTYGPFATEAEAEAVRDTHGEFRGYDDEGHKVIVGWVNRDGTEYLVGLTHCCNATAKGTEAGIVCRSCYQHCSPSLGAEAHIVSQPADWAL